MRVDSLRVRRRLALSSATLLALTAACGSVELPVTADDRRDAQSRRVAVPNLSEAEFAHRVKHAQQEDDLSYAYRTTTRSATGGVTARATSTGRIEGHGDRVAAAVKARIPGPSTLRMLVVDETMYVRGTGELDTGGKYVREKWRVKNPPFEVDVPTEITPARLDYIYGDLTSFESRGTERMRGVPTRHYAISFDPHSLDDHLGYGDPFADYPEEMRAAIPDTVHTEVWVDADAQVRKAEMVLKTAVGGRPVKITQVVEAYDYGADFDIRTPRPGQIADSGTKAPTADV